MSMMHEICVLILAIDYDDNNTSVSLSDESLSLEFPPPPSNFSSFVQTMICRSESGKR
jgi:hypothetical protein